MNNPVGFVVALALVYLAYRLVCWDERRRARKERGE